MLSEMIDNSVDEAGFRPLIRGFFFYEVIPAIRKTGMYMTVSVPSFGDSFFIKRDRQLLHLLNRHCFRPLIRGFFFYNKNGINFTHLITCFRPLIRGFFFYGRKGLYR